MDDAPSLFVSVPPGLEPEAAAEARAAGFAVTGTAPGGVTLAGGLAEAMRANLTLRGAGRVLLRAVAFRAPHLALLDRRARRFPWADHLRADVPVTVEAACTRSRIWHEGAARDRVATAIAGTLGSPLGEGGVRVLVRIDDDLCTISLDTSGAPLHRRGLRGATGKAPLRETVAALFLARMGFAGAEPVVDPMCGSGTIPIAAAEIAAALPPGRARAFAFERMAGFDAAAWAALKAAQAPRPVPPQLRFAGSDRDQGAVALARANAERAGVAALTDFARAAVSEAAPPAGPPGIVLTNPPWGARLGERRLLHALYGAFGQVMRARFAGWRVGVITPDAGLAASTALPFADPGPPVANGGQRVFLFRTEEL